MRWSIEILIYVGVFIWIWCLTKRPKAERKKLSVIWAVIGVFYASVLIWQTELGLWFAIHAMPALATMFCVRFACIDGKTRPSLLIAGIVALLIVRVVAKFILNIEEQEIDETLVPLFIGIVIALLDYLIWADGWRCILDKMTRRIRS